ncbi:MAG: hypothetical protein AMJ70_06165 [Dehalococcoidia bacterium SG8_51_3]|nr:MAG: hypothetical protein AMJ70_06165 [Dehalococcoidia bacterium SG8_51_3]
MVQTVQAVETVKTVHHRGQKSEIRDQLYPDLRHLISDLYPLPAVCCKLTQALCPVPCGFSRSLGGSSKLGLLGLDFLYKPLAGRWILRYRLTDFSPTFL